MLGDLLKQLLRALGWFISHHTRRLLHLPQAPPPKLAPSPRAAVPAAADRSVEAQTPHTATAASIDDMNDAIGLDPVYLRTVQWPCRRLDTPSPEITSDDLYQLWSTIPNGLKWTHYFQAYDAIFAPIRNSPLRILEIGIWQGASVQLWRKYFAHPQTIIVGIDILPECRRFDAPTAGVHVRIGSQGDPAFLRRIVDEFGPFDLVIDDGSHHSSHIIASFNALFGDGLKPSGIYFVEDLHANYWHPWRDSKKSFLDVCKELLEHMHSHYRGAPPLDFLIATPSTRPTAAIEVPRITTMIREMRFFDSIVAIHKADHAHVPYFLSSEAPTVS